MGYPIHGKVARFEKNSVLTDLTTGWTINTSLDLAEITAQGDNWRDYIAGLNEWDGSLEVTFDPSNTQQVALVNNIIAATPGTKLTDIEWTLEDTGDYFSGDVFLTGFSTAPNISGGVTATFTFKGSGALSLTIA